LWLSDSYYAKAKNIGGVKLPDLENYKEIVVDQARKKEWNNETWWLKKKLAEEYKEFIMAVEDLDTTEEQKAEEFSDMMIVILQIAENEMPTTNLDYALKEKISDNWKHKKKTFDSKTQKIIRK